MKTALADGFSLETDRPTWRVPEIVPSEDMLRTGIATIEASLVPADVEYMKQMILALEATMPSYGPASSALSRLRTRTWTAALRDIPQDLWEEAHFAVCKSGLKRFPTPGEFREHIGHQLELRQRMLARAKLLLKRYETAVKKPAESNAQPKPEDADTPENRLIVLLKWAKSRGQWKKAQGYENELAPLQKREREVFDQVEALSTTERLPDLPAEATRPVNPEFHAILLRSLAKKHKEAGRHLLAFDYEARANELAPPPAELEPV